MDIGAQAVTATDYLLVVRHDRAPRMLSAERASELRFVDKELRLSTREVFLDQTAVGVDHLPLS